MPSTLADFRSPSLVPALALVALVAAPALIGCEEREIHVFGAQRFDSEQKCLEEAAAVDVVDGPDPGQCDEARCWRSPGGELYVTTTACDAPPDYTDVTSDPAEPACAEALDALADKELCAP